MFAWYVYELVRKELKCEERGEGRLGFDGVAMRGAGIEGVGSGLAIEAGGGMGVERGSGRTESRAIPPSSGGGGSASRGCSINCMCRDR